MVPSQLPDGLKQEVALRWIVSQPNLEIVRSMQARGASLHLATILANRGIDANSMDSFLTPRLSDLSSPWEFRDMAKAAQIVADAIQYGAKTLVHSDGDADGLACSTLLTSFFQEAGAEVITYTPSRAEGHGVREHGLNIGINAGVDLILTADTGVDAHMAAKVCRQKNIAFVVTDHHIAPETLPDAYAIVNPNQDKCSFPFKGLAGCGVALFLLIAVRKILRDAGHPGGHIDLKSYLDVVTVGTISDVCPIIGDNRLLVAAGMAQLESEPRMGLAHLMHVAGLTDRVTSTDVAFKIGPRINSAGRLASPDIAFRLLMTQDPEEAATLAEELNTLNLERQRICDEVTEKAEEEISRTGALDRKALVLAGDYPQSVSGIVAGKLKEKYNRPAFIFSIADGLAKGSGRSIPGFHLRKALDVCSDILDGYGGHELAAGASLAAMWLDQFKETFCRLADDQLPDEKLEPELRIDLEIGGGDINLKFLKEFSDLEPFGVANPQPIFTLKGVELNDCKVLKDKHVALTLRHSGRQVRAVGFNMAPPKAGVRRLDLALTLSENEWNGQTKVNALIADMKEA